MLVIFLICACMNGMFFPVDAYVMLDVNHIYRCMNECLHDAKRICYEKCLHFSYLMLDVFICML